MAYLNKIDINGRTYYLQHLTDGKYEARLPNMDKDAKIIIQDNQYSNNVGDTDTPVYIKDNKVVAFNKSIGDVVTPVYVKYGNIQPLSADIGNATNPIYMKAGAITASNETVGSGIVPIYMQDGVITPSTSTVGTNVKPMYLDNGTIIESDATVGSGIKPVYMQDGTITASDKTVGTNIKLIYLYEGTITESNANVGSGVVPTYMNNGEITASTTTVGSNVKPIYLNAGTVTVSDGNVGTINQPIYMSNGEITVCSDNVGSAGVPVYMANGVITACDTIPIISGGTGAKTKEEALENFGLTATAAELNTLDGITATVTELNYVDGVTSNIQSQFDNQSKALSDEVKNREDDVKAEEERAKGIESDHESRIATMETFFKEADIDASQEFIDTLKEIQTYIEDDKTGAAAMSASIQTNKTAIETETGRAEGVEADLQSQITSEATTARAAEKANADAIAVLNGSDNGSVAKAVADARTALESEIAKKVDKIDGKGLSDQNYTADEKTKLEGIEDGANKYIHPSHDVIDSGFYKISFDELGHVSSVEAVTKEDIIELGIPAQDTTYEVAVATTETEDGVDGLLSATDKAKYDEYETTIAGLQQQISELKALVESYHPVVDPEPEPEPEETE